MGDMAALSGEDGRALPGLAQVAKQEGIHLGRALAAQIHDGTPLPPFRYKSRGNTAIVGRHAAVFETAGHTIKGWFAWLAWAVVHIYLLVGLQHRLIVSMQWLWRYLTYDRGARLITGDDGQVPERAVVPNPRDPLKTSTTARSVQQNEDSETVFSDAKETDSAV